ncbi:MAG: 6-O-methylguanine DNA methyltransferase [Elusimicrobia bacterium RIFOXYA2_FULL_39_19]|nr:MAG: 6-O-methylguanine DNA methyltransferase [Elusimicrobia bacterium RIFOXYA2_FULL_39_19]
MNELSVVLKKIKKYTEFQQKVWLACLKIPKGQTKSYKWIARQIARAKAYRAVGTALAKNPFAPVIPCHRVIKSNGEIGGYSGTGGIKAKTAILKREKCKKL